MKRWAFRISRSACLCACLCAGAGVSVGASAFAQGSPQAAASAASAPPVMAPTNAAARMRRAAVPPDVDRKEGAATEQIAVPIRKSVPLNPIAVKPGKEKPPSGTIDDSAARCLAEGSAKGGDCAKGQGAKKPPAKEPRGPN